jgi:pilus assembly protein Flp/PilA
MRPAWSTLKFFSIDDLRPKREIVRTLRRNELGATAVEYALMVGLIGIGIIASVTTLRGRVSDTFDRATIVSNSGTASQTSFYIAGGSAEKAIDGDRQASWNLVDPYRLIHTLNGPSEWWQVDLQVSQNVRKIRIYNREEACCWSYINNAYVMISPNPFPSSMAAAIADPTIVKQQVSTAQSGKIDIAISGTGRYVRIWHANNYLTFGEFEVYA